MLASLFLIDVPPDLSWVRFMVLGICIATYAGLGQRIGRWLCGCLQCRFTWRLQLFFGLFWLPIVIATNIPYADKLGPLMNPIMKIVFKGSETQ